MNSIKIKQINDDIFEVSYSLKGRPVTELLSAKGLDKLFLSLPEEHELYEVYLDAVEEIKKFRDKENADEVEDVVEPVVESIVAQDKSEKKKKSPKK